VSRVGRALCIGVDAEDDARMFASLARSSGFAEPLLLLGPEATGLAVRAALRELGAASRAGDLVLVTFSGHGGRKRLDAPGGSLESLAIWQLYDGALNDRQIKEDLAGFRLGVRVLVLSDNCSGGVPALQSPCASPPLWAEVMVLAACQHDQYADGPGLAGHFARALKDVWDGGAFSGTYAQFYRAICERMPPYQKPDFYRIEAAGDGFELELPFSI